MVTAQYIRASVRALGLSNSPLCVHSSLRSFGWVDGGADAVADGLLAERCTILVPSFSWGFAVPPPRHLWFLRNGAGLDCEQWAGSRAGVGRIYSPDTNELDQDDMGAIPAAVLGRPERVRGNHPLCSFAAVGPMARELVSAQQPLRVYAPLEALARAAGSVVLMGVGLKSMTLLHLAEQMAGRAPFRRWANGPDRQPMAVEAGGCSDGFESFAPLLQPIAREAKVGESRWRVFPAQEAAELAAEAIQSNPRITHCGDAQCGRCNDAVLGGPVLQDREGP